MPTALTLALLLALYGWIGVQAVKNAPPRARQQAKIRRVIDGDTLVVQFRSGTARTVRLLGIDAPESVHPKKPVQPFSHEAADWLRKRVEGKTVSLVADDTQDDEDMYGRLLRHVWIRGRSVEAEMLQLGLAREYTYRRHYQRRDEFLALQQQARNARLGLWSLET